MGVGITSTYAAVFALIYLAASVRVIRLRGQLSIALGDDGEPQMARAIRAHANFAEYVPLSLLLLLMLELNRAPISVLHVIAITLLIGRLLHLFGVSQANENYRYRVSGMVLTLSVIGVASLYLLALLLLQG